MAVVNGLDTDKLPSSELSSLRAVLDSLGALIFTKDREGRYTFANRVFCEMVGAPLEKVIGGRVEDFFDQATAQKLQEDDHRVLTTGLPVEQRELRSPKHNGAQHHYLSLKAPLYDPEGQISGLSGVSIDVTEQEYTEALLVESRQLLDMLLGNIDGHFYIKGRDRRYQYVSPKVAALFQHSVAEIVGHTDAELFPRGNATDLSRLDDRVFASGQRQAGEECIIGGDGTLHYFWSIKQLLHRADQSDCLIGLSMDITELKEAQRALAQSEARFRLLFEASGEAVLLFRQERFLDCNQAALALLGVAGKAECQDLGPADFSPPTQPDGSSSEELIVRHLAAIRSQRHHRFNWTIRRRDDGAEVPVEISATMVTLDGESVMLTSIHDLTEQKKVESTIYRLAYYDALTSLPNRRLFFDHLDKALPLSQRSGQHGAVIYLDLDNFKPVNDRYGHIAGDLLLQEAARRLTECVREQDTVARLGGDEFVALLVNLAPSVAEAWDLARKVAERIRDSLAQPYILTFDTSEMKGLTIEHHCTASLGMTLFPPCEDDAEAILKRADNAMYRAKAGGRNRIYIDERDGAVRQFD